MTPEQFCYWLQGRAELQPDNPPSAEEWQSIREHLQTVFVKVTPQLGIPGIVKQGPNHEIRQVLPQPNWWRAPNTAGAPSLNPPWIATC